LHSPAPIASLLVEPCNAQELILLFCTAAALFELDQDGTGGPLSWAFYDNPKKFSRVALCGQISEYEKDKPALIPNPFKNCIFASVKINGQCKEKQQVDEQGRQMRAAELALNP
jgi:hypothetical protein